MFLLFLIYAVAFAFLCGHLAQNKGYSFGGHATLGFFFGVFALLYVGFLRDNPAPTKSTNRLRKQCPDCAETILAEAMKCRFCGRGVQNVEPIYATAEAPPGKKLCRSCGKAVGAGARGCVYCNARL